MKTRALALSPLLLTLAAFAWADALSRPARVDMKVWGAPMLRSFVSIGTQRLHETNAASLIGLSKLVSDNAADLSKIDVSKFERLAASVDYFNPNRLAEFPGDMLGLLASGARQAEAQAAVEAETLLSSLPATMTAKAVAAHSEAVQKLLADSIYLKPRHRARLKTASDRIAAFKQKRREDFQAELAAIPGKIAKGEFDGKLVVQRDDGWGYADAPSVVFPTAAEAFNARLTEINAMPDGPWKADLYTALARSADPREKGGEALRAEGSDPSAMQQTIYRSWEAWGDAVMKPVEFNPEQSAARMAHAAAFSKNKTPKSRHVEASLRHYEAAAKGGHRGSSSDGLWIAKGMLKDYSIGGFPSLTQLLAWRKQSKAQAHRIAVNAAVAYGAAMALTIFARTVTTQAFVFIALGLIAMTSLGTYLTALWRRDSNSLAFLRGQGEAERLTERYRNAAYPAAKTIRSGNYVGSNDFEISVVERANDGVYDVRADGSVGGRPQYASFSFDAKSGNVFKYASSRQDFRLIGSVDKEGARHYSFAHGGAFSAWDQSIRFSVDLATGELLSVGATTKVARWGLPNGWHSGPIKETHDDFNVQGLRRVGS